MDKKFIENAKQPISKDILNGPRGGWGNVSLQICNLDRQINEVSLGSASIFRELGLPSSSFMLKNLLGKAIWSVSGEIKFRIFLGQSNHLAYTSSAPPSWTTFDTALALRKFWY